MKRSLQTIYLISTIAVALMIFFAPFTSAKMANMSMYDYIMECIKEKYYETTLFKGCSAFVGLIFLNFINALSNLLCNVKAKNYGGIALSIAAVAAYLYASPFNKYAESGAYLIMVGLVVMCVSAIDFGSTESTPITDENKTEKQDE